MSSASPITSKFLLLRWIFVQSEGKGIPKFSVSRVYYNFVEERVCLNDFENSYLCEQDSNFYEEKQKFPMLVKVIENAKGENNTRFGYLVVECRNKENYSAIKDKLKLQNIYGYQELKIFLWLQDYYYEDTIVDIKYL